MKKRIFTLSIAILILLVTVGCSSENNGAENNFYTAMVTDTGGVNDQSFNQSAWEGLNKFSTETGSKISYLESVQATDFDTNIDKLIDQNCDLIWGIGFAMADSIDAAARKNPDLHFAVADNSYGDKTAQNVTGVMFEAQESAFIVGYIAGETSKTGKVGFVGGMKSDIIDQFEFGYRAGVDCAAKELGKKIEINSQYVESFIDASKGKATAKRMYDAGTDVIFQAAGGTGVGVIEAAKDAGKFVIGVDRDQSYLAPDNVLTSALKNVGIAVELVTRQVKEGKNVGGTTLRFGLKDGCVGIPSENKNLDPEIYDKAMKIKEKVISGEFIPPQTETEYNSFIEKLG